MGHSRRFDGHSGRRRRQTAGVGVGTSVALLCCVASRYRRRENEALLAFAPPGRLNGQAPSAWMGASPAAGGCRKNGHGKWLTKQMPEAGTHSHRALIGGAAAGKAVQSSAEEETSMRVPAWSLTCLLVTVSLSVLGFIMPQPLMPVLRDRFAIADSQVGLITSAQSLGLMLAALLLPTWSDKVGRKPVLMVGHMCSAFGFFLQGLAINLRWSFKTFLFLRFITGASTCNPIFKAYIAAAVSGSGASQFMVYREAAAGLAAAIGPALGGLLTASVFGPASCLYAVAAAHLTASIILGTQVEEPKVPTALKTDSSEEKEELPQRFLNWKVGAIFMMSFFYVVGQMCFGTFFSLLMVDSFKIATKDVGVMMTKVSFIALGFQLFGYRPVQRRLGFTATGALGGFCLFLGFCGFGISGLIGPSLLFWVSAVLYALGNASFPASIPTLLAESVPRSRVGLAMGLDSVFNNLCRIIAPVLLGGAYTLSPTLCFTGAGSMVLVAVSILLVIQFGSRRQSG